MTSEGNVYPRRVERQRSASLRPGFDNAGPAASAGARVGPNAPRVETALRGGAHHAPGN